MPNKYETAPDELAFIVKKISNKMMIALRQSFNEEFEEENFTTNRALLSAILLCLSRVQIKKEDRPAFFEFIKDFLEHQWKQNSFVYHSKEEQFVMCELETEED